MASGNTLHFDPDLHPDDTLKAFNDFIQSFYLRYEAQYPDPPKVSIDVAIERWKPNQLWNNTIRSGMSGDHKIELQNFLECSPRDECTRIGKLPNPM